jgi:hypothetical protein
VDDHVALHCSCRAPCLTFRCQQLDSTKPAAVFDILCLSISVPLPVFATGINVIIIEGDCI